jgi:molecular chaperone DnaK
MLELDGQRLLLAEDAHGRAVVPSVVGFDPSTQQRVAGYLAWNRRGMEPQPVESIKRKMGLAQRVGVGPAQLSPAEVSAEILGVMRGQMSQYLARYNSERVAPDGVAQPALRVGGAVITVPAYFDAPQIEDTRRAGELAGFDVLGLLQEPTAACMYAVWQRELGDGHFLVYDLGGGTFDVSVIRALHGEYQVLSIHGDNFLGGDDFDRRLADHFRQSLVKRGYALDLDLADPEDQVRFLLLTRTAREVKEALSGTAVQYVARRDLFRDKKGQLVTLEMELSRQSWNGMMRDLLDSSIRCCHEALEQAKARGGVGLEDIDHVLLVGGSTRAPIVQELVQAAFCGPGKSKAVAPMIEAPDSCVALGAAIHAANLGGARWVSDAPPVSVHVTSPLYGRREQARVSGRVEGEASAQVRAVALRDSADEVVAEGDLDDEGRFRLSQIMLPDEGQHPMTLDCLDARGDALVQVPLQLYRSAEVKQTGSALSNPTVLAKEIFLEVSRQGKLERKVLIPLNQSLPASGFFLLYTGDQSGAVLLTLLQSRYPISTIHIEVPKDLPIGSPVSLEVKVDEKLVITAKGEVAGQQFWAQVEPPTERALKGWAEIEALIDTAEQVSKRLWGYDAMHFQRQAPFLISSIREAARTDPDKLQALVARLEQLVDRFQEAGVPLSPSYERFSSLVDGIRRIAFQSGQFLGLDFDGWSAKIDALLTDGQAAYDARDQARWSRFYSQAQALYETLSQEETRFERTDDPSYLRMMTVTTTATLSALQEKLSVYVLPKHPEVRRLQADALLQVNADLKRQVIDPLDQVQQAAATLPPAAQRAQLEAIFQRLRQLERRVELLPSIGVVVSHDP